MNILEINPDVEISSGIAWTNGSNIALVGEVNHSGDELLAYVLNKEGTILTQKTIQCASNNWSLSNTREGCFLIETTEDRFKATLLALKGIHIFHRVVIDSPLPGWALGGSVTMKHYDSQSIMLRFTSVSGGKISGCFQIEPNGTVSPVYIGRTADELTSEVAILPSGELILSTVHGVNFRPHHNIAVVKDGELKARKFKTELLILGPARDGVVEFGVDLGGSGYAGVFRIPVQEVVAFVNDPRSEDYRRYYTPLEGGLNADSGVIFSPDGPYRFPMSRSHFFYRGEIHQGRIPNNSFIVELDGGDIVWGKFKPKDGKPYTNELMARLTQEFTEID